VVLRLGIEGTIRRVELDTAHFKGNYPDTAAIEACRIPEVATGAAPPRDDGRGGPASATVPAAGPSAGEGPPAPDFDAWPWRELLPRTRLRPDAVHRFEDLAPLGAVTHARLAIHPDGGVSRLRLFGQPSAEGLRAAALARLDALPPAQAREAMLSCCGSPAWAERMSARRPFASVEELLAAADQVWGELGRDEWLAAFRAHPEIGGGGVEAEQGERARAWSSAEQAGARTAGAATRAALADANRAYRERFGHVYIVCATGRSAEEMLSLCQERLANDPEAELAIAGEEQRKITRLRLEKLLAG
jgi:allantoicase